MSLSRNLFGPNFHIIIPSKQRVKVTCIKVKPKIGIILKEIMIEHLS